jgi:hypothetical protein
MYPPIPPQFDDQNYAIGAVVPSLASVGTVQGLTYNSFVGLQSTNPTGIQPHSLPNEIVTALPSDITGGTAYIGAAGSTTYFDFHSFYFGCALDTVAGAIGVTTPCTVTATAYYEGKQLAVQEFNFQPETLLSSNQTSAKATKAECHTDFTGVDKVEITSNNPTLYVILMDNVVYTPHTCN